MDIRIIAAGSNAESAASPSPAPHGREVAFAAAWVECDQANARANPDATAPVAPESHTQEESPDRQDESSMEDQPISSECCADHLHPETIAIPPTLATDLRNVPNSRNPQHVEAELEPSVEFPDAQKIPSASLLPPNRNSLEIMEIVAERSLAVTPEGARIKLPEPTTGVSQLEQSRRSTTSSAEDGDQRMIPMAGIEPLSGDQPATRGDPVSARTHARQAMVAMGMAPSSKSYGSPAVDSGAPPTAQHIDPRDIDPRASAQMEAEFAAIGESATGNPVYTMEFTTNPASAEAPTPTERPRLGQINAGYSLYNSSTPPLATRAESAAMYREHAKPITADTSAGSEYTPPPSPALENIKNQPTIYNNAAIISGIGKAAPWAVTPRRAFTLGARDHAPTDQVNSGLHLSSKNWADHLGPHLQFETPYNEAGRQYGISAQNSAEVDLALQTAIESMDPGRLVQITEPSMSASTSTAVAPGGTTSHSPTTPPTLTHQVASAIVENVNAKSEVELILNPEELGALKFKISRTDEALAITISVDRVDTLQLLRRNLDTLTAELSQAGIIGASINFGDSNRDRRTLPQMPATSGAKESDHTFSEPHPRIQTTQQRDHAGRLNLRL